MYKILFGERLRLDFRIDILHFLVIKFAFSGEVHEESDGFSFLMVSSEFVALEIALKSKSYYNIGLNVLTINHSSIKSNRFVNFETRKT